MKDSDNLIGKENLYIKNVKNIITQYKNDIYIKAINLYLTRNYREAEIVLLTEFPENSFKDDSLVQYLMGHIKLKLQEFESSLNYFYNSLKNGENQLSLIYDSRGLAFIMRRDYNEAVRNFKEACTCSKNNCNFHIHLGLCYKIILEAQIRKEERILNLAKTKSRVTRNESKSESISNSKSVDSSNIISSDNEDEKKKKKEKEKKIVKKRSANTNKIINKIKEAFLDAININPNSYISLLNLGYYCANDGQSEAAEKYYKRAESIKKPNEQNVWKIYINLAYSTFKEKEYQLSIGYFEKVLKLYEKNITLKALNVYMICLYKNEEWKKLEMITKKILNTDRKNKRALVYLITCLEKNKKYKQLLVILKKIKSKLKRIKENNNFSTENNSEKDDDELLFNSPSSLYKKVKEIIKQKLKETNENIKLQSGLINDDNKGSQLIKLSKDTLKSFGFKDSDIEKIFTIYRKNPNNLGALFNIGYLYYKEKEFLKSEEFFKRIVEINPYYKKHIVYECLGDIYMNEYSLPKKALNYYIQSEKEETNELLFVKIGLCYEILDNNELALKYYKKANERNKEFVNPIFHIGCIYNKLKNPEALKWLKIAYEREKENVDYLQKYGDVLVQSDDESNVSKGVLILETGIEFFNGNVEIISSLAKGYEKQGKLKEAIELLEKTKNNEEFYNNKSKIFQLAKYYEKAKELTKSLELFKKVLSIDKKNVEALLHIGYIYRCIKENVKAFKCFKLILEIEPNNFLAFYGLGRLYQSLDTHDSEAIKCYTNCLSIDSKSLKANLQLGIIYLKIKKYEESLKCLQIAIELDPNNVSGLIALGNVYLEMNEYEEAEKNLNLAIKLDKKNVEAYAALADALFGLGKITEAIQKYIFVIKVNKHIPEVYLNLGHCYFYTEKFNLAAENYLQAIKLVKNTRHEYYYFLGNALVASNRIKDGILAYQAAIKLKSSKLNYYFAIAQACYIERLYSKGIKYLEKLLELEKKKNIPENDKDYTNNDILLLLYKLNYSLPNADYEKCSNFIKTLLKNDPLNIDYLMFLADIKEKTDHMVDAIKIYKQIMRMDPNNIDAKQKINLLLSSTNAKRKEFDYETEKNDNTSIAYNNEEEDEQKSG